MNYYRDLFRTFYNCLKMSETGEESCIQYYILESACRANASKKFFFQTSIPQNNIINCFRALRELLGANEICKDYSILEHNNFHMTIFPDGSCFCHQVYISFITDDIDDSSDHTTCAISVLRKKIANDYFPSRYSYDQITDIVDTVFKWSDDVNIVFRLKLIENNDQKLKNATDLLKLYDIQGIQTSWCELFVQVNNVTDENKESILSALSFLKASLQKKKTNPSSNDDCNEDK